MEYLVTKTIPVEELTEYKDYVGFLFKNENGVYNICRTEEEILKTNQWLKNLPLKTIIVTDDDIEIGDRFLGIAANDFLNGKVFKFLGYPEGIESGIIEIEDHNGVKSHSTHYLVDNSYKFIRSANKKDKEQLVNGVITPLIKI